jgi:protein-disulfide isomerase
MNKQFIAVLLVVVAALVGVFALTDNKQTGNGGDNTSTQAKVSEHTVGAGNKKVTLTEYGDFQCPACKQYFPLVKQVKSTYGDDIKFQFRHFPLTSIHPNAFIGSRAAEAAGKQGKFFEMHDLLYENQDSWSRATDPTTVLNTYAEQLKLNMDQFKKDMTSAEVAAVINADLKEGQTLGANSTPTFVINGRRIEENPRSFEEFKKLIDDEIAKVSSQN